MREQQKFEHERQIIQVNRGRSKGGDIGDGGGRSEGGGRGRDECRGRSEGGSEGGN
ncbi:hypothetical protein Glove_365g152 [Diversispora epigaea]|uniref:Uncharacterized protein n=1 Tax=Diversispora epigaea TaxID=1348612 RepID=A0A397H8R6_9GLOM|nr:hypothetical protein Glove_365g152 [Diversispora epigaea]